MYGSTIENSRKNIRPRAHGSSTEIQLIIRKPQRTFDHF